MGMDVSPIESCCGGGVPSGRIVLNLVDAMNTPRFGPVLFLAMQEAFRCANISAYFRDSQSAPQLLFSFGGTSDPLSRGVGERSLVHWNSEPTNRLMASLAPGQDLDLCIRLSGEEMTDSSYRRRCYDASTWLGTGSKLIDRITIVRRRAGRLTKINIYRHIDEGPFEAGDVTRFSEWSDLLFTLVGNHFGTERSSVRRSKTRYVNALQRHAPCLSAREAEVCAEIVLGRTSEAIAQKLRISINTVLTHRRRAYARLRISSQNELTHLVYDCVRRPAVEVAY